VWGMTVGCRVVPGLGVLMARKHSNKCDKPHQGEPQRIARVAPGLLWSRVFGMRRAMKIAPLAVSCLLLVTMPLFARDKSDVLIMNNGDHLTCEIKSLDASVLYVSLDYVSGTVSFDWSKVRRVESKQLFMVKTEDGSVYTGTLSTAETGGNRPVRIEVAVSPETNVALEREKVVAMNQTSNRFWQRFNGSINMGLIYSKGNQSTQYNFETKVQYPRERWSAGADFNSTLAVNTGASASTRNDASLYARRLLRWNNWFYTGLGNFLQSSEQNIQLQSNLGGGVGRYVKNTNHAVISLSGGLAWQNTRYTQSIASQASQNVAALLVASDVEFFKFNKTNLTIQGFVFPAISEPGRVFASTNMTYYVKFFGNFTWNLSFYGNWDNRPPAQFSGSDYGASSGIGWTFGNQ
jgi:Protein of unknown function, DUF481